ncbi:MAG: asparagine synthase (glutamine-hydrolyzing) [Acidobacteriota bacterium]
MCGIAGSINLKGRPVELPTLQRMNDAIAHRGPDGEGFYCQGPVGLAQRRLAIIDPQGGVQPFYSDDQSLVLIFNGEVYNYVEIRKELAAHFPFHTDSDTEVVLKAYQQWGIGGAIERFQGMFAFALYDTRNGVVYLVRDRVGIKPLYYYLADDQLIFSSEVQSVLKAPEVRREISPEAVASYLRYQYVPAPNSIYQNLHKLEPGCLLKVDLRQGTVEKSRYWQMKIRQETRRAEGELIEEFNALFDEILKIYVRSDVPFGAFLSGGVDSSLVAAVLARHLDSPVQTFTIGFEEEEHSETPFAREASRIIGAKHTEKIVLPDHAEDLLSRMVRHFGEPFGDSSAIPTYYVSQVAAGQVKMVLSGDGGDELFGGYNSYQATYRQFVGQGANPVSGGLVGRLLAAIRGQGSRVGEATDMDSYLAAHNAQREGFGTNDLRQLLAPHLAIPERPTFKPVAVSGSPAGIDPVTWFQAQDFNTYMVDDVLTKVDRMSMANSLEVRVPLLDHKVVEFAFALPLSLRIRPSGSGDSLITKYLLKKSAGRYFSDQFLARPKRGFGIPVVEWCRGRFRPLIEEQLRDRGNPVFAWLNYPQVELILNDFFSTNPSRVAQVWYIFMLSMWVKHVHEQR